jgi:hypothetical protein
VTAIHRRAGCLSRLPGAQAFFATTVLKLMLCLSQLKIPLAQKTFKSTTILGAEHRAFAMDEFSFSTI